MRELKSIEERILDRALYLIGKNGSSNVSIRAIAKEAEVNVSAINYYFRSKEEMLRHVKDFYINNTLLAYAILDSNEYSDEEKLILCANEIMEYTIRYPGIIAILRESMATQEEDEMARKVVNVTQTVNEKMYTVLANVFNCDKTTFQYVKMIFLSSILYPTSSMDIIDFEENIVNHKESRLAYIQHVVKSLKFSLNLSRK